MSSDEIEDPRLSGITPIIVIQILDLAQINKYIRYIKQIACDIARYPVTCSINNMAQS